MVSRTDAAVLVPVYRSAKGELRLVLIRRGSRGIHGGQIAFPGGKAEPGDGSPVATALREAQEEIGLRPGDVEVLAVFPAAATRTTGFRVVPVLGRVTAPGAWSIASEEVAEIIELAVGDLARPEARASVVQRLPAWPKARTVPGYCVGRYWVWGLTYRILEQLVPRLLAGEWPV